ncbi:hypothetical protein Pcinc_038320 [Petrolisthes cinctipes]|uniref:Uncharacterized protein n=1 Tax=Petrolisthes cinctipes TaxID=88211 RepID=A0AAE1ELP8_PETCI|nr:hypothetical protein Pcinc_038320 [Petrolisthes cinctipes]
MRAVDPSVHFISNSVTGDYLVARDVGLPFHPKFTMDFTTHNISSCRVACWTHLDCVAAMAGAERLELELKGLEPEGAELKGLELEGL